MVFRWLGVLLLLPVVASAQQFGMPSSATPTEDDCTPVGGKFPCVKYLGGHEGFAPNVRGTLVIGDSDMTFSAAEDGRDFRVPAMALADVKTYTNRQDASTGMKLLFGNLAKNRRQDILQLFTETDSVAEGMEFEVPTGQATNIVAKIHFLMKRAGRGVPAAVDDTGSAAGRP